MFLSLFFSLCSEPSNNKAVLTNFGSKSSSQNMPSKLMYKAVEIHTSWNNWLGKCPVRFDPKTKLFTFSKNHKEMLQHYFNLYYGIMCLNVGSTILLLLIYQFGTPSPNFTMVHYTIFMASMFLQFLILGVGIFLFLFGEEGTMISNALLLNYRSLENGESDIEHDILIR